MAESHDLSADIQAGRDDSNPKRAPVIDSGHFWNDAFGMSRRARSSFVLWGLCLAPGCAVAQVDDLPSSVGVAEGSASFDDIQVVAAP